MDLSHLIIFPDIAKLPKSDLVNLATDLQLDTVGTAFDLANRIWKNIKEKTNRKEIYSNMIEALPPSAYFLHKKRPHEAV